MRRLLADWLVLATALIVILLAAVIFDRYKQKAKRAA